MQKERIAILNGIFGTIPAGDSEEPPAETRLASNLLDISSGSGNAAKWSGSAFIDAEQLLGDTVQPSSDPGFNTYQGKRIIVDDGCPVSGRVYTTYLFGAGAVAFGNGNPVGFVPTETDRAKSGKEGYVYIEKKRFVDRLNYIVRADWDLECCFVLPFTLQPSVLKQVGYLFIMQDL